MAALLETCLPGLAAPKRGKVREVYDLGDTLLIVATDRISAFDVVMANGVPDKGRILNQMSAFWFERFVDLCPNHLVAIDDDRIAARIGEAWSEPLRGRCAIARRAEVIPVECVARGYLTGSLYKEYRASGGGVHGLHLPSGLLDGDRLPEPIFSPATKATEGHDENISFEEMQDLVGQELAGRLRTLTLEIYSRAAEHAEAQGLILADTKFEFGLVDGELTWIDEALTPDSSRFWEESLWQPGRAQPSYDKQYVRDYLESIGWDKRPPGPTLPDDVIQRTREKYVEAYSRITGMPF
ncbi:MAG TPA: phosphoribosylaminoimidazolesuccinocarboxamide synthase [Fimbriimonadaceae bacterium]|nr:phosphoribosylaminoimidazolesuccinocarboxamide synthase [Fimbriimonadaceae bacterium]HRJ95059.1 phosphoribosylaminoimidazolesuccinocarboxamide synthase [Fimbriimonadaceae bacterium]